MPRMLRWAQWLVAFSGLVLMLAGLPARAAASYGLLDHFDVCDANLAPGDPNHDYDVLRSIAVDADANVYVGAYEGVRAISAGGTPLGTLANGPARPWDSPVLANGPAGVVYIGDTGGGSDLAQLAQYTLSGGNLVLTKTYNTPPGDSGIHWVTALAATQNRGLFVLDTPEGAIWNVNDQDGSFIRATPIQNGASLNAMTAIPNAIVAVNPDFNGGPDSTQYYVGDPLQYSGTIQVGPGVKGIADGRDGSIWLLDDNGIEHYKLNKLLETVPVHGDAIDTGTDGSLWVTRDDGILHLGPGGYPVPPDQYGKAPCGGPQITESIPHQSVRASHQIEVDAQCADPCSLVSAATMTVPGSRTVYKLIAPRAAYSSSGRFDLRLGLRKPGYNALVNTINHHRKGTVLLSIGSIDAGDVRGSLNLRITVSHLQH